MAAVCSADFADTDCREIVAEAGGADWSHPLQQFWCNLLRSSEDD